jgi:hypothetical protein
MSKLIPILIIKASLILIESFTILYWERYVDKFCLRATDAVLNLEVLSKERTYKSSIEAAAPDATDCALVGSIYALEITPYLAGNESALTK